MIKSFEIPDLGEEDTQGTITEILIKADDTVTCGALFMKVDIGAADVIEINRSESSIQEPSIQKSWAHQVEAVMEVVHAQGGNLLSAVSNPAASRTAFAVDENSIPPAGPATRRLARELGVELGNVIGLDAVSPIQQCVGYEQ